MNSVVLYLVRHGAIRFAAGKTFIGQLDVPLSEEGVEQALALHKLLDAVPFSRMVSSGLSRSRRTCEIIAGARIQPAEAMAALNEINLGQWEGRTFKEMQQRFPEEFAARGRDLANWRPTGGESFADCRVRVKTALDEILSTSQGNVLLVGHAGVNRLILCETLKIPINHLHGIGQNYGCLNIIKFDPTRTRVELMNYSPVVALSGFRLRPGGVEEVNVCEVSPCK